MPKVPTLTYSPFELLSYSQYFGTPSRHCFQMQWLRIEFNISLGKKSALQPESKASSVPTPKMLDCSKRQYASLFPKENASYWQMPHPINEACNSCKHATCSISLSCFSSMQSVPGAFIRRSLWEKYGFPTNSRKIQACALLTQSGK